MDCSTHHVLERESLFMGGRRVVRGLSYCRLDNYISLSQFHGWIDRTSLDKAGFAALHTIGRSVRWDLSTYDALEVITSNSDGKVYTISLGDERPISWEGDFRAAERDGVAACVIRFDRLMPVSCWSKVLRPLNLENITGFGIWIRNISGGKQEGGFSLNIRAINVVRLTCTCDPVLDQALVSSRQSHDREKVRVKVQETARDLWNLLVLHVLRRKKDLIFRAHRVHERLRAAKLPINRWNKV